MRKAILSLLLVLSLSVFVVAPANAQTAIAGAGASASADSVNVNAPSQGQGQDQGQQQGQSQLSAIGLTDIGNIKDSFNSNGMRGFAIPADNVYGPVINYFGKPLPGVGFQPVEQFLMYGALYSEGALKSILDQAEKITVDYKMVNDKVMVPRVANDRWIRIFVTDKRVDGAQLVGYVTSTSENKKATMVEVMAAAALAALEDGCNAIQFTAQGAHRDAESSGWGIGFNTTYAKLFDATGTQDASIVGGGGFGYSSTWAGMRDKPWLQAATLAVPKFAVPQPPAQPKAEVKAAPAAAAPAPAKKDESKLPWYQRSTLLP